jgi:hypothetical protein
MAWSPPLHFSSTVFRAWKALSHFPEIQRLLLGLDPSPCAPLLVQEPTALVPPTLGLGGGLTGVAVLWLLTACNDHISWTSVMVVVVGGVGFDMVAIGVGGKKAGQLGTA